MDSRREKVGIGNAVLPLPAIEACFLTLHSFCSFLAVSLHEIVSMFSASVRAAPASSPSQVEQDSPFSPSSPADPSSRSKQRQCVEEDGDGESSGLSSGISSSSGDSRSSYAASEGDEVDQEGDEEEEEVKPGKVGGRSKPHVGTNLWTPEMDVALRSGAFSMLSSSSSPPADLPLSRPAALPKVPNMGSTRVGLNGQRVGRTGLLAEYVKRQTGEVRNAVEVASRIKTLSKREKPGSKCTSSPACLYLLSLY